MTVKTYVGNSGVHVVPKIFVGNSGVRKVIRAYAGVGSTPKLVFTSDWFRPEGISLSNVIAAWQFKGASSESASRVDLTGHNHGLLVSSSGNREWTSGSGYKLNGAYLFNSNLYNISNLKTIIIRYSNMSQAQNVYMPMVHLYYVGNASITKPILTARSKYSYFYNGAWLENDSNYPGAFVGWSNNKLYFYRTRQMLPVSGVVGFTNGQFYINGSAVTTDYFSGDAERLSTIQIGGNDQNGLALSSRGDYPYTVVAAAFFSENLGNTAHAEVYRRMMEI